MFITFRKFHNSKLGNTNMEIFSLWYAKKHRKAANV